MASNNDSEDEQSTLMNIMFGNINEKGEAEADFLDEESRKHLASLRNLGMGQLVQELTDSKEERGSQQTEKDEMGEKSPSAVDFFDMADSVPEEDSGNFTLDSQRLSKDDSDADDEEDYDDRKLMPPPAWAPRNLVVGGQDSSDKKEDCTTPLRSMLPPQYSNIDVTELFPAFKKGQVLRFSRLFKPNHKPVIYRKKKKKTGSEREQSILVRKRKRTKDGDSSESESDSEEDEENIILDLGRPAKMDEVMADDEELLMRPVESKSGGGKQENGGEGDTQLEVAPWRYGPAQLWYDKSGVDERGEGFDYGFRLKKKDETEKPPEQPAPDIDFPSDAFLMVAQRNWEEDIIMNGEDWKHKVLQSQKQKAAAAGWIPSTNTRTAVKPPAPSSILQRQPSIPQMPRALQPTGPDGQNNADNTWYSIFPIENSELCYGNWEDDIIWDAQNMDKIPTPQVMTLDLNDENIILGIPEDRDPNTPQEPQKKEKQETKKCRYILGKQGLVKEEEEEKEEISTAVQPKDAYNISNDEFYNPKIMDSSLRPNIGNFVFQHSTPAVELVQPFFPTHMGEHRLRTFHRNPLKRYSHGALTEPGPHPVQPLHKTIKRKAKQREMERQQTGGGETFFMRTVGDLSGMDGDLILAEYTEEYPPLTMQIGMATKIKNYYKRKPGKDVNPPQYQYGELAYAHNSPFLGVQRPGECQPALENSMFRAPIYQHSVPETDFLIIRTRNGYYIRDVDTIFCVGQEHPLIEVPGPNSKSANNFARDFLQVFIYRLFRKSKDEPKRIKMEDIRKAFPTHSESSIRKRLKLCADFKRTGMDSNWWVLKPEFRLPTEEEIRNMVSPEQCCAYYSFITAEQRLKDAGYGDTKNLFAPEDENEEETQSKMDDEVRAAPWNTTRAFIAAMKGKCLLQLSGPADPTGCGEGFSYVKVPNKPQLREETQTPIKKTVTGTDADLRRLNLKDARNILRKFGMTEAEIKRLSRWQVINVVREISTEHSKAVQEGEETDDKGWSKFARGNKYSTAEHYTRYKEESQKIFDLQSRILSNKDVLSTDDESSSANDSDIEEMGKDIETMITNKKTSTQLTREKEEAERQELQKIIRGEMSDKGKDRDKKGKAISRHDDECSMQSNTSQGTRRLIIKRTFKDDQGHVYTREEIVRKADVLDTYMRIRQTKEPSFIKQFAAMDDQQKEEMRKERRRIQEQLRRIKRNQEKPQAPPPPKKKKKEAPPLKMKCGACGQIGHMRTNKECPMYNQGVKAPSVVVAMTEEQQEEEEEKLLPADKNLINVDGTKLIVSKNLAVHAATLRRKSLVLKVPKQAVESKKKRRLGSAYHCDYLKKPRQSSNRRRTDPLVSLSTIFDNILKEVRSNPASSPFLKPVNAKEVQDYYKVIKVPMDLQTIREKNRAKKYESREQFINDIHQIHENSLTYNGERHTVTSMAHKVLEICLSKVAQKETKLMRLEKAINPLLDDDDQVAFSFILEHIVEKMSQVEGAWPFLQPVNKKNVKDYYDVIKNPMDISTLRKNVKEHKYHKKEQFLADVEQIYTNCMNYNGVESAYTATARTIMEVCKDALKEKEEALRNLERDLEAAHQAALDGVESESIVTGTSFNQDSVNGGDNESFLEGDTYGYQEDELMDDQAGELGESDSEFVDIEGYDDNAMDMTYGQRSQDQEQLEEEEEDELAKDLQVTDEEDGGEMEQDLQDEDMMDAMEQPEMEEEEEEEEAVQEMGEGDLQQYADYQYAAEGEEGGELVAAASEGDYYMQEEGAPSAVQDEDENSFDPTQFFMSSSLAQAQAQAAHHVDINSDLQVSESEDEGEDQQQYSDQGFDLDQYLQ